MKIKIDKNAKSATPLNIAFAIIVGFSTDVFGADLNSPTFAGKLITKDIMSNISRTKLISAHAGKAMDTNTDPRNSTGSHAILVTQFDALRDLEQSFDIKAHEDGESYYIYFSNKTSNAVGPYSNQAGVTSVPSNSYQALHKIYSNNDGTYTIKNISNGMFLALSSCSRDNNPRLTYVAAERSACGAYSDALRWKFTTATEQPPKIDPNFSVPRGSLLNLHSGYAMDISGGNLNNKTMVTQYETAGNGAPGQMFGIRPNSLGGVNETINGHPVFRIESAVNDRYVLDASGRDSSWGKEPQIFTWQNETHHKWIIEKHSSGAYRFISAYYFEDLDLYRCEVKNGGWLKIRNRSQSSCDPKNPSYMSYLWTITSFKSLDGEFVKDSALLKHATHLVNSHSGAAIDVPNGNFVDNQYVVQWVYGDTPNQKFNIVPTGTVDNDGGARHYKIETTSNNGYVFLLADSDANEGSQVKLKISPPGSKGLWRIHKNNDGSYSFQNVASGRWMELGNFNKRNGTSITMRSSSSASLGAAGSWGKSMRWYLN